MKPEPRKSSVFGGVNPMSTPKTGGTSFTEKVRIYAHWLTGRMDRIDASEKKLRARLEDPQWVEEFPGRAARSLDRIAEFEAEREIIKEGMRIAPEDVVMAATKLVAEQR